MKPQHTCLCFCLSLLFTGFILPDLRAESRHAVQEYQDSTEYQSFQGKVVEIHTNNPIIFASIFLSGTNIGTVSNSEGEFLIKIPMFLENKVIGFSSIGYRNLEIPVGQLNPEGNLVELEPNPILIEEVTIVN
ncbi:MAG: carboxypeptidase-like regulatory domain-containing protein, partial [Bacteroidales bacterium]|nr:carboxypeptidase-like regulatory domain-containing protein [Bacteroidales bacterium]